MSLFITFMIFFINIMKIVFNFRKFYLKFLLIKLKCHLFFNVFLTVHWNPNIFSKLCEISQGKENKCCVAQDFFSFTPMQPNSSTHIHVNEYTFTLYKKKTKYKTFIVSFSISNGTWLNVNICKALSLSELQITHVHWRIYEYVYVWVHICERIFAHV